jgi:LysR family transcriptional regulator, glycine cleavage system transcriptional activator
VLAHLASITLHSRKAQSSKRIRVLSPPTFAREILVPKLKTFSDKHPDFEIEIVVAIPYLNRDAPQADVVISFGQASGVRALLREPVFAVAEKGFAKRHGLKTPKDLTRLKPEVPLIRCPLEPWTPWFAALGLPGGDPKTGLKVVDLGLMLEAAAQGHGVALARASLAASWLASGRLVRLFEQVRVLPSEAYLLGVHEASTPTLAFAQWLRTVCRRLENRSLNT